MAKIVWWRHGRTFSMARIAFGSSSICVSLSSSIFAFLLMDFFALFDFCLLAQWDFFYGILELMAVLLFLGCCWLHSIVKPNFPWRLYVKFTVTVHRQTRKSAQSFYFLDIIEIVLSPEEWLKFRFNVKM